MDLAQRNLDVQRRTLDLAREKKEAGIGNAIDVAQATTIYGQTEATLPTLEILRRQANHRLCHCWEELLPIFCEEAWQDSTSSSAIVGPRILDPGRPIATTPDVRQAEQRLAQQSAKIGVAEGSSIHTSASLEVLDTPEDFGDLFQRRSSTALLSPWVQLEHPQTTVEFEVMSMQKKRLFVALRLLTNSRSSMHSVKWKMLKWRIFLGYDRCDRCMWRPRGATRGRKS